MSVRETYRLVVQSGDAAGLIYALEGDRVTIGRGPENTIQVIDRRTSRAHASLARTEGGWRVRDLGSRNGTLINDRPIRGEELIRSGDRLLIGETLFVLESEPPSAAGGRAHDRFILNLEASPPSGPPPNREVPSSGAWSLLAAGADEGAPEGWDRLGRALAAFGSREALGEAAERLLTEVASWLQPSTAALWIRDAADGTFRRVAAHPPAEHRAPAFTIPASSRALQSRSALLWSRIRLTDADEAGEDERPRFLSVLCAPLIVDGDPAGLIYLERPGDGPPFEDRHLRWLAALAEGSAPWARLFETQRIRQAESAARREAELTRALQEALAPLALPQGPQWDLGGLSAPGDPVGGDYYDAVILPDGDLALILADVAGKGSGAVLGLADLRGMTRALLRLAAGREEPARWVMEQLNEMVCQEADKGRLVTMVVALVPCKGGRMSCVNAGHVQPLVRKPNGELRPLVAEGGCLGAMPGAAYPATELKVSSGTCLLIYSDGLLETTNAAGERFGADRVAAFLESHFHLPAQVFCRRLEAEASRHRGAAGRIDDVTLLFLKVA